VLVVRTPAGDWWVDGMIEGPGWQRTGTPPYVSAKPSIILIRGALEYHGWLQDGLLRAV
jgi:hypothetical protein